LILKKKSKQIFARSMVTAVRDIKKKKEQKTTLTSAAQALLTN
jgi:hypothetical protein